MAYRRRRRFRGAWVPSLYSEGSQDVTDFDTVYPIGQQAQAGASLQLANTGVNNVVILPVAADNVVDTEGTGNLLNDSMQGGWALRRIVGKVFVGYAQRDADYGQASDLSIVPTGILVTVGFFVARVEQEQDILPIGSGTPAIVTKQYNPRHPMVNTEPWIWRRSWVLGNPITRALVLGGSFNFTQTANTPGDSSWNYPPQNAFYGSLHDGPHIDCKTKRRILADERLFISIAARYLPYNTDLSNFMAVSTETADVIVDLRFFGALRRKKNRSAF